MPVPVLVLNHDGCRHLDGCFASLAAEAARDERLEPWLIDNGSRDGSVELVRARFPEVRIVALAENLGFAGAYDRVLRDEVLLAGRDLVVLLNNDTRVLAGWLAPLVEAAAADDVAIAGSLLLSGDGSRVDHAGGVIAPNGGGIDLGKYRAHAPAGDDSPRPTGFACGGALLLKRRVYLELGGFDPEYVIYHEDVDLAWRAWMAGWRVLHVPRSVVHHEGGALMGRPDAPRRLYLCQRNRLRNLVRNAGTARLLLGLATAVGFDAVRAAAFASRADWDRLAALWRADAGAIREIDRLLAGRAAQQGRRRRSDAELAAAGVFASLGTSIGAWRAQRRAT